MSDRSDHLNNQLKDLIRDGLTDQAIKIVWSTHDLFEVRGFVITVLGSKNPDPELVDATLNSFSCCIREACGGRPGF